MIIAKLIWIVVFTEFVHALGEPGNEDSCEIEDEDEENLIDVAL